jgi:hypothetical protein
LGIDWGIENAIGKEAFSKQHRHDGVPPTDVVGVDNNRAFVGGGWMKLWSGLDGKAGKVLADHPCGKAAEAVDQPSFRLGDGHGNL